MFANSPVPDRAGPGLSSHSPPRTDAATRRPAQQVDRDANVASPGYPPARPADPRSDPGLRAPQSRNRAGGTATRKERYHCPDPPRGSTAYLPGASPAPGYYVPTPAIPARARLARAWFLPWALADARTAPAGQSRAPRDSAAAPPARFAARSPDDSRSRWDPGPWSWDAPGSPARSYLGSAAPATAGQPPPASAPGAGGSVAHS